ncbi:MAG: glutathione S-transferase, partial [Methylibium sp.]|nr:glutathione S-transferase [Methylibium sp.]
YALLLAQHLGLAPRFTPAVKAYSERLQLRAAYLRALRSQEAAARLQGVSIVPAPDTLPAAKA